MRNRLTGVRIAFVVPSLAPSTIQRQIWFLAKGLISIHDATMGVFNPGFTDAAAIWYSDLGATITNLESSGARGRKRVLALARLLRSLRRFRPHIVLSFLSDANIMSGLVWRRSGARAMIWHQWEEGATRPVSRLMTESIVRVPCFSCSSHHSVRFLSGAYGVPGQIVHYIPHGIPPFETAISRSEARRQLQVPEDAFVAGVIASEVEVIDLGTLMPAWSRVKNYLAAKGICAVLLLADVGDVIINDLGWSGDSRDLMSEGIHALGFGVDKDLIYAVSDVYLAVLRRCGLPLNALRAVSHGVPLIATNISGITECLECNSGIRLVPVGFRRRLEECIITSAENKEYKNGFSKEYQCRIRNMFSLETMVRSTSDLLENI